MKSRKVMLLTSSYPRRAGDYAGIFVAALAGALRQQEMEVAVLAPHGPGLAGREVMDGIQVIRYSYAWPASMERLAYGGGILPNLLASRSARLVFLPYLIATFVACLRQGKRHDVIHAHWIHNGWVAGLVNFFLRKTLVVTVHGPDLNALARTNLGRWIIRSTCRRADSVIAVSESIRQQLLALRVSGDSVHHIPNGVPNEDAMLAIPLVSRPDGRQLLYVGRLVPQKTVANLLTALVVVLKQEPTATLSIVGEGSLRRELAMLTGRLKLGTSVRFVGAQPRQLMPDWFSRADVFVLPSRVEGFPIVILEAMAAGRPIVATAAGGVPEIITDHQNGLIVPIDDPAALATAILQLLRNVDLRMRLAAAARSTISKQYRWSTIATSTITLYARSRA